MEYRIVNYKDGDESKYTYGICECLKAGECIEIPRRDYSYFLGFQCPKCGRKLGIYVMGTDPSCRPFSVF